MISYGFAKEIDRSFEEAVAIVSDELKKRKKEV